MINILHNSKIVLTGLLVQTLTFMGLVTAVPAEIPTAQYTQTSVEAQTISETDQKYLECLSLPVRERETCAREIGQNLKSDLSLSPSVKIQECLKLRPVFYSFCIDELR